MRCHGAAALLALWAAAALPASVQARVVVLTLKATMHTDQWCADHHLGEGPSTCIQHPGCCYDGRIKICHSCDAHSDEWCLTYGGTEVKQCIGFSGCTFDSGKNECISNSADDIPISDEVTCEEGLKRALDAGEAYMPMCTEDGQWKAEQFDAGEDKKWCVDPNGHEVPGTRRKSHVFEVDAINCAKERRKHGGEQCPNSVTLTLRNGEVMVNDHEDVGNCTMRCNTDKDCKGGTWCCYNGCGYSCQLPIFPKADCQHLPLDVSLRATDLSTQDDLLVAEFHAHDTRVRVSCAAHHSGAEPIDLHCKHGSWTKYEMKCFKDCEPYAVPDGGRERDYHIEGKDLKHGATREVRCAKGYGAVAGSPDAMYTFGEELKCINGAWEEQTLVCSACFDRRGDGPEAWWTGMSEGTPREEGFDCLYFESRPLGCAEHPDARENCRVSCRSCKDALRQYKVLAVRDDIKGVNNHKKWLQKRIRNFNPHRIQHTEMRNTRVAHRVKPED